jgi:hypothetical protein
MCIACGSSGIGGPLPGRFAYSHFSTDLDLAAPRRLDEVVAMSPEDMARASRLVSGFTNGRRTVPGSRSRERSTTIPGTRTAFM